MHERVDGWTRIGSRETLDPIALRIRGRPIGGWAVADSDQLVSWTLASSAASAAPFDAGSVAS